MPSRRLTNEQIKLMRQRRKAGASQYDLAEDFGITQAHVSVILRGIRYPDAPGPIEKVKQYCRRRNK
jgi:transcriptional regulator